MKALLALWALLLATGTARADTPVVYPNTQAAIGASQQWLSDDRGTWSDRWLQLTRTLAQREIFYGSLGATERFGRADTYYAVGAYVPVGPRGIVHVEETISPTHAILPASDLIASVEERLPGGWGYAPGYEQRAYSGLQAQTISLMVDRYVGNDRLAYRLLRSTLSSGASAAYTHAFTFTRYYGAYGSGALTASVFFGRDIETAPNGVVLAGTRGILACWKPVALIALCADLERAECAARRPLCANGRVPWSPRAALTFFCLSSAGSRSACLPSQS